MEKSLSILHLNTNRNPRATETALDLAVSRKVDILCIQEPWILTARDEPPDFSNPKSTSHPSFTTIFPNSPPTLRPRTLIYVSRSLSAQTSLRKDFPQDPDFMAVDVIGQGFSFLLINIYNEENQQDSLQDYTVDRILPGVQLRQPTIVCGDFNAHHSRWNPSVQNAIRAEALVEWVDSQSLSLLNTPGVGTFHRPQMSQEQGRRKSG